MASSCSLVVAIRFIHIFVTFSIHILYVQYTSLEVMVRDASKDHSNPMTAPALDKVEKNSARPRGSSSPFRCISNLVHQMNLEKEHELSTARLRIEELELLATSRQKEVYRLARQLNYFICNLQSLWKIWVMNIIWRTRSKTLFCTRYVYWMLGWQQQKVWHMMLFEIYLVLNWTWLNMR